MSRAVILPHPIDPFMLNYWLYGYKTIWQNEVDRLYIVANSPIQDDVVGYVLQIAKHPKITILYHPEQLEHGEAINRALNLVREEHVMLIEDDCYIFQPGQVDHAFSILENSDIKLIGSKRGSCHPEILQQAKRLWGLSYEGLGDQGCNFWPNLLWTSKANLLKTDRNFGAKAWNKGEVIKELGDYVVQNDIIYGDTFVWASLQLRNMVREQDIRYVPQYHGHPDDLKHYENRQFLWDGGAPWVHVGSLSSGVHGILKDAQNRPLAYRIRRPQVINTTDAKALATTEMEKNEYARRIQWWLTFSEHYERHPGTIGDFHALYKQAIERIIGEMQISIKDIRNRQKAYKSLGLW